MVYTNELVMANEPDPSLEASLEAGLDDGFYQDRDNARRILESSEIVGFWLQGVGDGSPLPDTDPVPPDCSTPHQLVHIAGFSDDLKYDSIRELIVRLTGHHFGVLTDTTVAGNFPDGIIDVMISSILTYIQTTFQDATPTIDEYQVSVSLETQLRRADRLLANERLTGFWLQVMLVDSDSSRYLVNGPVDPIDPAGPWTMSEHIGHPIEFMWVEPLDQDDITHSQLGAEYLAQHAFVGARMTDLPISEFLDEVRAIVPYFVNESFSE